MSTTCIICYTTWKDVGTKDTRSQFEKELQVHQNKFLFSSFCSHFDISPSLSSTQWNFQQENLPFCATCQETVKDLIDLDKQLESVQKENAGVKQSIKYQIVETRRQQGQFQQIADSRIKILQDLIVGPELRLSKLPQPQKTPRVKATERVRNRRKNTRPRKSKSTLDSPSKPVNWELDKSTIEKQPQVEANIVICPEDVEVIIKEEKEDQPEFESDVEYQVHSEEEEEEEEEERKQSKKNSRKKNKNPLVPPIKSKTNRKSRKKPKKNENQQNDAHSEQIKSESKIEDNVQDEIKPPKRSHKRKPPKDGEPPKEAVKRRKVIKVPGEQHKFSYCGFEFSGMEENGFRCCLCSDKQYNRQYDVVLHIRWTHMNEKKRCLCDTCGKDFHKESELRRHVKTHGPGQNVKCHICGGAYKDEYLLARHVTAMHDRGNTALCHFCSATFFSEHKLLRHIQQFHSDVTTQKQISILRCKYCDCTFVLAGSLTRHMRRYHKDVLDGIDRPETMSRTVANEMFLMGQTF